MSYPSGYIEQLARPLRSRPRRREVPPRREDDERGQRQEERERAPETFAAERLHAVHGMPPRR